MKKQQITLKIILSNSIFIFAIYVIRMYIKYHGKVVFYNTGSFDELLMDIAVFLVTIFIPSLVILCLIFYFYLKPLEATIRKIRNGEEVSREMISKSRRILKNYALYIVIFNILVYLGGHIGTIIKDRLFSHLLEMREFSWVINVIASACLYSFGQITISNQIFAEPRKLLNMYYLEDGRNKNQIGLRIKNILLYSILIVYALSFYMRFISIYLMKENYYADQIRAVMENKISLSDARENYKMYLYGILEPGMKKEQVINKIRFPYDLKTDRFAEYITFFIASFICMFAIGFVIVFLFSRELTMQIRNQRSTIDDILQGKESLSKRISIIQYDEVGSLSDMINTLMDKLKDILEQIRESSITVSSSSDSLNSNLLHTSAAVEEMVASLEQITSNMTSQVNVVESTKKKLETMLSSIDKMTVNIESEASFVEETASMMQEMARNITQVNDNTMRANDLSNSLLTVSKEGDVAVRNTIEAIRKIEGASDHILQIVEVLTNLSSQTDLLAINTAIEAAHAGQFGRGFAIIANEIRKLSEVSGIQTKEISRYIMDMIERVKNGVQLSGQAGMAFEKINNDIEKTTNLINEITFSMNEQKSGTDEILSSVDSVVSTSVEVKNIANNLKTQSQIIRDHMNELYNISSQIDSATKEQEKGNKEILTLINNVKEVSMLNITIVNKLKTIISSFK